MSPTALLLVRGRGETAALVQLIPPVHDELLRLARSHMRRERRLLVDSAPARGNDKRGGGVPKVPLDEDLFVSPQQDPNLVALDAALKALEAVHPRKSQVVELRFCCGYCES